MSMRRYDTGEDMTVAPCMFRASERLVRFMPRYLARRCILRHLDTFLFPTANEIFSTSREHTVIPAGPMRSKIRRLALIPRDQP